MIKPFSIILITTATLLLFLGLHNYLLFHLLIEIFCVMVGFSIYSIGWNAREFIKDDNLFILSIGYIIISIFNILHLVSINQLNIFSQYATNNISLQFWLAARAIEAISFFLVGLFIHKNIEDFSSINKYLPYIFIVSTTFMILIIFSHDILPVCSYSIDSHTYFKTGCEYILSIIFVLAAILFWKNKQKFNQEVFWLLFTAILISVPANLLFSLKFSVNNLYHVSGHILKYISFFLVYKALVVDSLQKPYHSLFQQYNRSQKRLVATGTMISTLFHDLKNPLSTIKAISQIGSMKTNPGENQNYFKRIEDKVEDISHMITRMLNTFKPEKPLKVDLINLFHEILDDIKPICKTENIKLIFHNQKQDKELEAILEIEIFKRAIKNLIHNAIKALDGEGKIEISIEKNNNHILIKISDDGPGIPQEIQNTLFKPFVQAGEKGTGLGLYMVYYTITTIHHGQIWFKTKQNQGTTFYLKIPVGNHFAN